MKLINAVEELGTQYLALHMRDEMRKLPKEGETIDIADAKICKDCISVVNEWLEEGIKVVDSKDADRNALLGQISVRKSLQDKKEESIPLLSIDIDITDIIDSLNPDIRYIANPTILRREDESREALVVLFATLICPEVEFCLDGHWAWFLDYVYRLLPLGTMEPCPLAYEANGTFAIISGENDNYRIPGVARYDYYGFVQQITCIPAELITGEIDDDKVAFYAEIFGNEVNSYINTHQDVRPKLKEVLDSCLLT